MTGGWGSSQGNVSEVGSVLRHYRYLLLLQLLLLILLPLCSGYAPL